MSIWSGRASVLRGFGAALTGAAGAGFFDVVEAAFGSAPAVVRFGAGFAELLPTALLVAFCIDLLDRPEATSVRLAGTLDFEAFDFGAFDFAEGDFLAFDLPAAVATARAGAFPRPPPNLSNLPPAGRPAADDRLGFARRFAFAMRPRYLHIQRNVNGATLSPRWPERFTLTVICRPLPWCTP